MKRVATIAIALLLVLILAVPLSANSRSRLRKVALPNPRLPDFTSIFNWGLRLSNIRRLYFFSGIAAQRP
ncbi:MAG: hypothetical protein AAFY20_02425, partial [Cyanobacteria bacterium J06639_14]